MLDQLRALAVFARAAELGSFRAAGLALGLSPSVVSHHIQRLEQRYGVALFYRTTRSLRLTAQGQALLEAAKAMLVAAERGLDGLASDAEEPVGSLTIAVPAILALSPWIDHIGMFIRSFPKVSLALDFSDQRVRLIDEGFDLALRLGSLADSSLKAQKLGMVNRHLYASDVYAARWPQPTHPNDLAAWDWLTLQGVVQPGQLIHPAYGDVDLVIVPRARASSATALYHLARAGAGIVLLPDFLGEADVAAGRMRRILPDWQANPLGLYAVWPSNASQGSLTRRFIEFIAAEEGKRLKASSTRAG